MEPPKDSAWYKARKRAYDQKYHRNKMEKLAGSKRPETCEVCGHPSPKDRPICFDHNHATDKFRGWLCLDCNVALGNAGDNPEILRRLASYLDTKGHAATRVVWRS